MAEEQQKTTEEQEAVEATGQETSQETPKPEDVSTTETNEPTLASEAAPEAEVAPEAEPAEDADAPEAEAPDQSTQPIEAGEVAEATAESPAEAVAEEPAEEAAVAEAPAETEPVSDGPVSSVMEDAVTSVMGDMTFPSAGASGVTTEAEQPVTSISGAEALPTMEKVGYTGEIVGRVVKLEELDEYRDEEEETGLGYEQLMKLVDETFTKVTEHEIVEGRVVNVGEKDVVIDIGFKSDGVVARNEFERDLKPGDTVEVFLERLEDYHGQLVLSKLKADKVRRWQRIEDAYNNEMVIEGTIVRRIKGGMIAELDIGQVEAFLPGSQIDVRPVRDFDAYLEKRMEFKIVKLNPANENIVVSHKALIEKELQAQREKILATMEAGQVLEGTVKNITDFGVFIDLGGVDGLLHITDLSWGRVSHPSELVDLDEKMNVVVLDYDKERQRISLGLKQLQPHPWENIGEKFDEGEVVEGKVVSITDYGAFVELEKGIEGLVHISEMSWTEHIKHPSQMVALGQLVKVKILNIDEDGKKISLGMKQLEPDPWTGISDRYPPGTVMRGRVRNITNFGVFVEIEPGIDGLVHISDLSWTKKVRHPGEMIKKGQDLDVVILNIDEKERRISLGHKQVQTNPWNQFSQVYATGAETEAKVVRLNDGGVVVELPMGVEAFVPASELKNGPSNFQDFYEAGQDLDLQVIKFDPNQKEIVLSEVAKFRAEERAERAKQERERREERDRERREVRQFSEKAASGPTTLGELSGLADLKAQIEEAEAQEASAAEASAAEASAAEASAAEASAAEASADEASADEEAAAEASADEEAVAEASAEEESADEEPAAEASAAEETADEQEGAEETEEAEEKA